MPDRPTRALPLALALGLAALLPSGTARAADGELLKIVLATDGTVRARLALPYPIQKVRRILADPVACQRLSPDVLAVTSQPRGDCQDLQATTRGLGRPFHYSALRCPTPQGWQVRMTGSQDLSEYTAEWQLVPSADGGTEVRYHVKLGLNAGVPRFLLNQAVKKSTADTMDALKKAVAAR